MALPTVAIDLQSIGICLIALLVVSAIVGFLALVQRWHRFSRERREAIRRWAFTVGIGAFALLSWSELVDGSTDLVAAFGCLYFVLIFANYLRYQPKPARWEQESPATERLSPWEMASARSRVVALVSIVLSLSAGVGMLAFRLV